jgi:hypothetical protein
MKRLAIFALLATAYLLVVAVPGLSKKKPTKPIIETLEATIPGGEVLRFEIEEFSTEQDIQELKKAYAKGGKDDVEGALRKVERGRYFIRHDSYPIRMVQSESQGGTRTVYITADAADQIVGDLGGRVSIGHRGYPFAFTQLRIDEQGKGVGQQVPFAAITFNKQGIIDIKSMPVGSGTVRLVNVHTVAQ